MSRIPLKVVGFGRPRSRKREQARWAEAWEWAKNMLDETDRAAARATTTTHEERD